MIAHELRRLNYLFLTLTYPEQMRILVNLDLLRHGDEKLDARMELPDVIYERAKLEMKLGDLEKAVDNRYRERQGEKE